MIVEEASGIHGDESHHRAGDLRMEAEALTRHHRIGPM
jgi:hypothetical protein